MKLYQKYHTLGVYVDTWGFGEGVIPHVFLGLKIEYRLVKENFNSILDKKYKKKYATESDVKEYNLITQMQLIEKLTERYMNNDENKKKWLEKTTEFDKDYLFFRRGYKDITLEAKAFFNNKQFSNYQEYKGTLVKFIESSESNIAEIEGFFGFAPYKSAILRTSSLGDRERGGKVYQNNHYEYERIENNNATNEKQSENSNQSLKDDDLPSYSFSKGHILTNIRPLSTFQSKHAFAMKIPTEKHREVVGKVLEDVLITDDDLRGGLAFVDDDSYFRFYALMGRSCVNFVMDKLKIIFGNKLDWWDKITWTPQGAYDVVKKHSKRFNAQELSITQSLLDIELFHQNYATLCSIDSSWECENGLKAFGKYCNGILHSALLDDTKANRLGKNKIDFLSRNADIENIADDISMRLNTHFCVYCYFQDAIDYDVKESKISLLVLDENKRFLKADKNNDFVFSDFNFADDNDKTIQALSLSMYHQQPIIFHDISNHNICKLKKHHGMYIQTFIEHFAGLDKSIGDYRHFLQSKDVRYA